VCVFFLINEFGEGKEGRHRTAVDVPNHQPHHTLSPTLLISSPHSPLHTHSLSQHTHTHTHTHTHRDSLLLGRVRVKVHRVDEKRLGQRARKPPVPLRGVEGAAVVVALEAVFVLFCFVLFCFVFLSFCFSTSGRACVCVCVLG
jgi:hypothetical protein